MAAAPSDRDTPPDPGGRDPQAPVGTSPGASRRMPPLGWIVVVLVLGLLAIAAAQWRGTWRTPSGGSTPMAEPSHPPTMPQSPPGPPAPNAPG